MSEGRRVTKRVPVTLATRKMLKKIANAFDTDYDTAINFLIHKFTEGKDPIIAARMLEDEFGRWEKTYTPVDEEEGDEE